MINVHQQGFKPNCCQKIDYQFCNSWFSLKVALRYFEFCMCCHRTVQLASVYRTAHTRRVIFWTPQLPKYANIDWTLFRQYCEILSFARVALEQCNSSAAWACVSLASLLGKMATTLQQRKVQRVEWTIVVSSKNCSDLSEISMASYVFSLD